MEDDRSFINLHYCKEQANGIAVTSCCGDPASCKLIFQDKSSSYENKSSKQNIIAKYYIATLYNRRMQDIAILINKALHDQSSQYIKELFKLRKTNYNLRGTVVLILLRFNTVTYGKFIKIYGTKNMEQFTG